MLTLKVRDDLCLDYANTLSWRGTEKPTEELNGLADLVAWIERTASVAHGAIAASSVDLGERGPWVFAEAIAIRETIFRIFSAFAAGEDVAHEDFAVIGRALSEAPARDTLLRTEGTYAWRVGEPFRSMPQLLAPVLWSAGDLMVNAARRHIRRCANEKCLWMFVDESKSGTRRWCQMSACGNREKARRHYSKVKQR